VENQNYDYNDVVCAETTPDNNDCTGGGHETCHVIESHYETRCDTDANGNSVIYWYDDCGKNTNEILQPGGFCTSGCTEVVDYSACFVAGTQVTMADGTTKNIEEVQVGEKIRGKSGVNTVVGFHRPLLGNKALYAFNDGEPFVTAEHPFLTTAVFKL